MAVIESTKDLEALTLTIVAEFPATPERVWRLWEDPRQLERWWGPPGYPATFFRHDFAVPGRSIYYMTSPEGERHYGWWNYRSITAPNALEIEDGFGDADGNVATDMPEPGLFFVTIEPVGELTRMTITSKFESAEQLEELLAMGQEEGMTLTLGQIDAILAETRT